jgi:hypothetical protein
MSSPFWTLISGPGAVVLYQNLSKRSNLNAVITSDPAKQMTSDGSVQTLVNTALLPIALGYAGSYAVARFSGVAPLYAAAGGALVTWLYYDKMSLSSYDTLIADEDKTDTWLKKEF